MSIPLIGSLGTLNQSAALAIESQRYMGERMVALGQTIGNVIAERQAYNDANTAAPFIQQSFQEAYQDIRDGNSALGVGKAMGIAAQFQGNPILSRITQEGVRLAGTMLNDMTARYQINAVTGRSEDRMGLQRSRQAAELQKVIDNAEQGINDPNLSPKGKQILQQRRDAALQMQAELTGGQPAGQGAQDEDFIAAPGERPPGAAPDYGMEGELPVNEDIPMKALPFGEGGEVIIEEPPQGDVSEEAMAWAQRYRDPRVWNRMTDQQKAQVDQYINDVFEDTDIQALNATKGIVPFGQPQEPAQQQAGQPIQRADGAVETQLNLDSSILGSEFTFVQDPKKVSRTSGVGPSGYSGSTSVQQAQMPKQVIEYTEAINNGLSVLPIEAADTIRRFGGLVNMEIDVSGSGDSRELKIRPKGSKGKAEPIMVRDQNGILQKATITKDDAAIIDKMESSVTNLMALQSATERYGVSIKPLGRKDEKIDFYEEYQRSLIPQGQVPFGLSEEEVQTRLGVNTTRADDTTKELIKTGMWVVFDTLNQKDAEFRTLVETDPNKAINRMRDELDKGTLEEAKEFRKLIKLGDVEQVEEKNALAEAIGLPTKVQEVEIATPAQTVVGAAGAVTSAIGGAVGKVTGNISQRAKLRGEYEEAKTKLNESRRQKIIKDSEYQQLRKKLDSTFKSELEKL